jgi:hypothetical protein
MYPNYYMYNQPYPYGRHSYLYPYPYPYSYNSIIDSQISNINQTLYNAGYMAGVNQIAYSNNVRF